MSETSPVTPECGDTRAKANAILDAAQRMFAAFGYRRTAMDDIARAAGVAKGTLYFYFDGKEAVFRAMHARTLAELSRLCDEAENADLPFPDKLYQLLDRQCGTVQERYARSEHLMELDATRTTIGADLARDADDAYAARLVRVLRDADNRGEIDLAGADLAAESLVSTLLAAAKGAKQGPHGPVGLAAYRDSLRQIAQVAAAAVRPR
ncbi:MAG: helix-turn-helix domain-containing protein [Phenylobacterium sp.]|uniref:TetR/AcrR family transcriptional regulator n=1 Tax=Phenylobacterium sp. TaxID=1871053 RepID=UPI0027372917|nr:TetR/AcrR family transcriptional regulator [Phenylobacterium sp.]MDP3747092.1 helix-turn-helix domain-containing protein [Phenylobacterium sp.]